MTRRLPLVLALLAVAVAVGGFIYWIAPHLETYEYEVIENVSEKARRNPFLAMQRFLERLGYAVETSRRSTVLDTPPAEQDTILLEFSQELFSETRTRKLRDWIMRGGHLVLELNPAEWTEDEVPENELLQPLDLRIREKETPQGAPRTQQQLQAGAQTFTVDPGFVQDWLEDGSGSAETWRAGEVPAVLRYRVGEGRLTLIPTRNLWNNDYIGRHEHAAFLTELLGAPRGKLWVLSNVKLDSLLQIIWRHAMLAVIALLLTTGLVLWGLYNRFGPLTVREHHRRRSLGEHVQAMANFAWQHGRAANLLAAARLQLRQRAELRHPGFQHLQASEQYAWLAGRIQVSPEIVRRALDMQAERAETLIDTVTLLQKLRASL